MEARYEWFSSGDEEEDSDADEETDRASGECVSVPDVIFGGGTSRGSVSEGITPGAEDDRSRPGANGVLIGGGTAEGALGGSKGDSPGDGVAPGMAVLSSRDTGPQNQSVMS